MLLKSFSQNVENITEQKPLKVNGSLGTTWNFYNSQGMDSRQDPYFWMFHANATATLFNTISLPFSATFTKSNKTYNQPSFKEYGASPTYKGYTVHLGYRNMSLSSYSLAGLTFLGGGVEVKPNDSFVSGKAMYGRLAKGISYSDSVNGIYQLASFERWAYGGSIKVGKNKHFVELILFKAWDDIGSVDSLSTEDITPMENVVGSIKLHNEIIERIIFDFEFAGSAITTDLTLPDKYYDKYTFVNNMGNIFTPNVSTEVAKVIIPKLSYNGDFYTLGLMYRYIDPGYRSLGASYMSNDIEEIAVNGSLSLYKNKMNFSGNFGSQHDNLNNTLEVTSQRLIGALSGSFILMENLNWMLNFSNYSTSTSPGYIQFTDSLKYAQLNTNYSSSIVYSFKTSENNHSIGLNGGYQEASILNNNATSLEQEGTKMYNTNLSYRINLNNLKLGITSSINYSEFIAANSNRTYGPVLGISRSFLSNKIRSSLSYSYLVSETELNKSIINLARLNASYNPSRSHSFRFNLSYRTKNITKEEGDTNSSEIKAIVSYNYIFNYE